MKKTMTILLFLSSLLVAQTAGELISAVQNKFKSVDNFSAKIVQTKFDGKIFKGKFYYGKGNKYRIEFKNMVIVSDGKTVWNYNKKINRVVITNLEDNPDAFSFEKFVFDFPGKCKTGLVTKSGDTFVEFIPETDDLGFERAVVRITSDSLIDKVQISDYSGNQFNIELKNIKINQSIPKTKFTFKPKKGMKIVDLR